MPVQNIEGLKGLKGWGELSDEEKEDWLNNHPKYRGLSYSKVSNGYANQNFVDTFDLDAFNSMSRKERDALYRHSIINQAVKDTFKDDENYNTIMNLTDEGKLELFDSKYLSRKERARNIKLKTEVEKTADPSNSIIPSGIKEAEDIVSDRINNKGNSILFDITAKDNNRKSDSVRQQQDQIIQQYKTLLQNGNMDESSINSAFDNIALKGTQVISTDFGDITYENPGSRIYSAFKDAHEMSDFGLEDKLKLMAEYQAIQGTYGTETAQQILENRLQDYVADHQNVGDWFGSAALGISTKFAANIVSIDTFLRTMTMLNDPQALANYLEGKDKNGNPLPFYRSPQYWEGVDQFGSFNPEYIDKVREEYGGVSEYNWLTRQGDETNFLSSVNEAAKMAGYIAAGVAVSRGLGAAAGGTSALLETAGAQAAAQALTKVSPYVIGAVNAMGISEAYGIGTYEQTLQDANEQIDKQRGDDAKNYAEHFLGADSGLKYENGKFLGESDESKITANLLNNYTENRINELLEAYPNASRDDIDIESVAKDGLQVYDEILRQRYLEEHDSDYEPDREMARKAAATAYYTDALLEQARMTISNLGYRKYMMDKSTRQLLNDNYPKLGAFEENGKLVAKTTGGRNVKWANISPVLQNIWGGARDNYLDDITVAFSKGLGLSYFNDYHRSELSPQEYAASTNFFENLFSGVAAGIAGANEAFVDEQSFHDGLIGGLGGAVTVAPRLKGIRERRSMGEYAGYDSNDLRRAALDRRIVNFSDYIDNKNAVNEDIQSGKVRKKSFLENVNDYIFNPLLQDYSDAAQRTRDFQYIIDTINEEVSKNAPLINDFVNRASTLNERIHADKNQNLADSKDLKAKQAFQYAAWLDRASKDPVYSQSSDITGAQQRIQRLANGDITEQDINEFYNEPENKSMKDSPDAVKFATERLQSNAKQLVKMQESYNDAMNVITKSKEYNLISHLGKAEQVAEQLAFGKAMYANREERISEMEKELRDIGKVSDISSPVALYGSEKGRQDIENYQTTVVEKNTKKVEALEKDIDKAKNDKKVSREQRRINVQALELSLKEAKRQLSESKSKLDDVKKAVDSDFSRVLSKEEILALNPEDRAEMFREDSKALYSRAQKKVINELREELKMKNPNLLDNIQDIAILVQRNKDVVKSNSLIQDNIIAAANYYSYAETARRNGVVEIWNQRLRDSIDSQLDSIDRENVDTLRSAAKRFSSSVVEDYVERHPDDKTILEPTIALLKLGDDIKSSLDSLYNNNADKLNIMQRQAYGIISSGDIVTVEDAMRTLEDVAESYKNTPTEKDWDALLEKLQSLKYLRDSNRVKERNARREAERKAAEEKKAKEEKSKQKETQPKEENLKQSGEGVNEESPSQTKIGEKTIDSNGSVIEPSAQDNIRAAELDKTSDVLQPLNVEPEDSANVVSLDGVMIGNALYEYDGTSLVSSGESYAENPNKTLRLAQRKEARGALKAFYEWEDATDSDIQGIIDNELADIVAENPDIEVRFIHYKNSAIPNAENIIFNAVEYTDNVARIHNEELGGVVQIGDKRYLIIGTLGFNPSETTMRDTFNNVSNSIKSLDNAADGEYFVHPDYYTKIDSIYSGMITDGYTRGELGTLNTLGSLMSERLTNPHGITYSNAMFGIMYSKSGFVLYRNGEVGKTVYPPRSIDNNVGVLFLMVPSSNGNYIPIAFEPAHLSELTDGSPLKKVITDAIDMLVAPDAAIRNEGLKKLSDYLVFTKDIEEVRLNGDTVSVVRNDGSLVLDFNINDDNARADIRKAIIEDTPFRVNVTARTLQNPTEIEIYDKSGALKTTAAKLGTVNASYTVRMIDSNGKPIEKVETSSEPQQANTPTQIVGNTVTYLNSEYTITDDKKVFDSTGKEVKGATAVQIMAANFIESQGLSPEYQDGDTEYFRIQKTDGGFAVFTRKSDGSIKRLTQTDIDKYNRTLEKKRQDDAAKRAVEERSNIEDKKPVTPKDNMEKTFNFKLAMRNTDSRAYKAVSSLLSRKLNLNTDDMTVSQIKEALRDLNISYETVTNEDSFVEMIENCK